MIKNRESKRTKTLHPILQRITHRLMLSGTPALSRPVELWTQMRAVRPDLFPNFRAYSTRYCGGHEITIWRARRQQRIWLSDGCTNPVELHLILKCGLMIRRRKEDVLKELPDKIREQVLLNVPIPKKMEKAMIKARRILEEERRYEAEKKALLAKYAASKKDAVQAVQGQAQALSAASGGKSLLGLGGGSGGDGESKKDSILEMYSQLPSIKKAAVCEYLKDFVESLEDTEKFLVFAHHKEMMDAVFDTLKKDCKMKNVLRIDGSTAPKARAECVEKFQGDDSCRVAVLSITAAGVGLTLTKATTVLFAELNWTPGILKQAEDRAHRIGQKCDVLIKYLIARNTIEEDIWDKIEKKIDTLSLLLDNKLHKSGFDAGIIESDKKNKHKASGGEPYA